MTTATRSRNSGGEQLTPTAEAASATPTASPTKKRGRPRKNSTTPASSPSIKKTRAQPARRRSTRLASQSQDDDNDDRTDPAAELELSTSGPKRTTTQRKQPKPTDSPLKTGLDPTVLDERRHAAEHSYANDFIANDRDGEEGDDDEERQAKQIVADDDDEVEDGQPEQADYDDIAAPPHDIHTMAVGEEAAQYPKDAEANEQIDEAQAGRRKQRGAARDNAIDQPLNSGKQVDDAIAQEEAAEVTHTLAQQEAAHNGTAVHDAESAVTAKQATTRGTATDDAEGSVRAAPHDSSIKNIATIGSADNKAEVIAQAMHDKRDEVTAEQASVAANGEQAAVPAPSSPTRQTTDPTTIRRKFVDSLVETLSEQKPADVTDQQIQQIATAIEAAVYELYGEANNEYRAKLRELVMDLKPTVIDAKVRERILRGGLTAAELVKLNVREIGPPELQTERREAAKESEYEHVVPESEKERVLFVYQTAHGQRPGDMDVHKLEHGHLHRETGDTLATNDDLMNEDAGHDHEQAPISELTMPAAPSAQDAQAVANDFIADQAPQSSASPPAEETPDPNEHSIVGFTNAPDQSTLR